MRRGNPGFLGQVRAIAALPLALSLKSRWRSHESGVKPGSLAPDSPVQAISLLLHAYGKRGFPTWLALIFSLAFLGTKVAVNETYSGLGEMMAFPVSENDQEYVGDTRN